MIPASLPLGTHLWPVPLAGKFLFACFQSRVSLIFSLSPLSKLENPELFVPASRAGSRYPIASFRFLGMADITLVALRFGTQQDRALSSMQQRNKQRKLASCASVLSDFRLLDLCYVSFSVVCF